MLRLSTALAAASVVHSTWATLLNTTNLNTCQTISKKVSSASGILYPLEPFFFQDIQHWFGSSSQVPTCVFEAGNTEDVATALQIIGNARTPFAVMSGGHASNPGFSSTTGVHISFRRMQNITFNEDKSVVEMGMGLTWSQVYEQIEGSGVMVTGGRVPGPGLGGFTLGGGYSWKTNQHGLTCDTVKSFTLVQPNGTINQVDSSQPDLFFALKGGLNRFGVVTKAQYYTHPQPSKVWGGLVIFPVSAVPALLNATAQFESVNTDPKSQVIITLEGGATGTTSLGLFFHDGPEKPESFSVFDGLDTTLNFTQAQTFSSFVSSFPSHIVHNPRGVFNTISTYTLTDNFLAAVKKEVDAAGKDAMAHGATFLSYDVEPFLTTWGEHATDSAYPHSNSPLPLNLYYAWQDASQDAFWYASINGAIERLTAVAKAEGIYNDELTAYPNYAISGLNTTQLYGKNAVRLEQIRQQHDPEGIMELAGGFAF